MGLWDRITGEFVDIIEWTDTTGNTLVHRFERYANEIKYGAKLIVRESQIAVFVNKGVIADVFEPGIYTLKTDNMPVMSTLEGWKHGFQSPFKAEVYFVSTRNFTDLKWGTKNPIMMRDAQLGIVRLRAFGTFVIRVIDAPKLIREITGTNPRFTLEQIADQLRDLIVSRASEAMAECPVPAIEMATHYSEIAASLLPQVNGEVAEYGLEVTKFLIENISLPPEVEAAIDKRSSMGVVGDLNTYTQYQTATAIGDAANNPGGAAAGGMGLGMGMVMANQMGTQMNAAPPPVPQQTTFYLAVNGQQAGPYDMNTLRQMIQGGTLTRDTLAWRAGMAEWQSAGTIAEFAGLFGQMPPPLPPQER